MTRTVPPLLCAVILMAPAVPAIPDTANGQLFEALRSVDKDAVHRLIEAGADPNARNEEGETPLHLAAGNIGILLGEDAAAVVEFLLDAGSVVNAQLPANYDGWRSDAGDTPLHVAAKFGLADVCRLLLQRGANVHARNAEGETALHNALSLEQTRLLLDAGADMEARDAEGQTALHHHAASPEHIRQLLDAGADIETRDARGKTTLHYAVRMPSDESFQLLLDAGSDIDVDVRNSVQMLLEAGANVDARDSWGNTPLLEIASSRNWHESMSELVQLLLEAGADINARNAVGMNTLEFAQAFGREDFMRLLLGVDADAEAWNSWEALGQRFQLYNACNAIDFLVSVDNEDKSLVQGLTEEDIQAAVESRLRAARLYDSDANSYLYFYVRLMDADVGVQRVAWVYYTGAFFRKPVQDEASGQRRFASTWERETMGTASSAESVRESILGNVRGYMDQFLAEYLRVNEDACE